MHSNAQNSNTVCKYNSNRELQIKAKRKHKNLRDTCMMLVLAKSFLLRARMRRLEERRGRRSWLAEDKGMRASRTSTTRSATFSRSLMARVAAAMWPGNQFMAPPPALKPISPNPFFITLFTPPIFTLALSLNCSGQNRR